VEETNDVETCLGQAHPPFIVALLVGECLVIVIILLFLDVKGGEEISLSLVEWMQVGCCQLSVKKLKSLWMMVMGEAIGQPHQFGSSMISKRAYL
jgi:hypothetical protein